MVKKRTNRSKKVREQEVDPLAILLNPREVRKTLRTLKRTMKEATNLIDSIGEIAKEFNLKLFEESDEPEEVNIEPDRNKIEEVAKGMTLLQADKALGLCGTYTDDELKKAFKEKIKGLSPEGPTRDKYYEIAVAFQMLLQARKKVRLQNEP